jgi:hypothetical protein
MRWWFPGGIGLAAVLLLGAVGCTPPPRAPALEDGPVYQNNREGFRFLVPDDWTQFASGEAPPGKVDNEAMLTEYRLLKAERPSILRVTLLDIPPEDSIEAYLTDQFGKLGWRLKGGSESCTAGGVAGTRFTLVNTASPQEIREVYAFRRGGRVYFFTAILAASDSKARLQVRRAIESLSWKQ